MNPQDIGALALLCAAAWMGWKALPLWRIATAIRSAPLTPIARGDSRTLVKIRGSAEPASVPAGFGPPTMVWQEESVIGAKAGQSSGTRSVAKILVRDETGDCLVLAEEARVEPAGRDSESDRSIFSAGTTTVTRYIRRGAPVFAVGVLGTIKPRPGEPAARCKLHRAANGVLLLSGAAEEVTLRRFQRRAAVCAVGAAVCVAGALWVEFWLQL